jgi:hypothetical protein
LLPSLVVDNARHATSVLLILVAAAVTPATAWRAQSSAAFDVVDAVDAFIIDSVEPPTPN